MCVNRRICATHPKDAPTIGQLGCAPQTACLRAPRGHAGDGGVVPGGPRVSGAALRPGCAFAPVPAGSTSWPPPSQASISDLMGSKHLPCPSAVKMLSCLHLFFFPIP